MTDTTHTGFDTRTYEVRLDDYHPGEYTNFLHWAEGRNEAIKSYKADDTDRGGADNPWANMPFISAELIEADWDDPNTEALAAEGPTDHWLLTGTANQLRELYHELLTQLATPAWHWYGMGGDDHAYDYWPNTMGLAVEFRDRLVTIGAAEADAAGEAAWDRAYHTTYIVEDLNRVYWACRLRYEADARKVNADVGAILVDDNHFDDFLDAEHFGPRPGRS